MDKHVETEELRGIGTVWKDGETAMTGVRYTVRVSRKVLGDKPGGDVPSLEIEGALFVDGIVESMELTPLIGEAIELGLQDGRRWSCVVHASDGTLVDRDGIK